MAKASIALAELVEKGAQDEIVRELLSHVADRLMEFEVEQRTGADYGERSSERSNSRNGYRDRRWETRAGSVDLRIPKLRRVRIPRRSWNRGARPRKRSWPWSRKHTSKAYRRVRLMQRLKSLANAGLSLGFEMCVCESCR